MRHCRSRRCAISSSSQRAKVPADQMSSAGVGATSHSAAAVATSRHRSEQVPYKGAAIHHRSRAGRGALDGRAHQRVNPQVRPAAYGPRDRRRAPIPVTRSFRPSRKAGWPGSASTAGTHRRPARTPGDHRQAEWSAERGSCHDRSTQAVFETGEERSRLAGDFGKLIREEYEQRGKLVKRAGVRAE